MYLRRIGVVVSLAAVLGLAGCATSRSVVAPTVATTANPDKGVAVRIDKVEDVRVFQIAPPTADIPSLSDDDIRNAATTSRAIARKRNGFGKAMGDVLLPEGQTVSVLTSAAIAQAFRESGYRVVSPGDPDYDKAVPVSARIQKFWAWMTPGFWAIALEQRTEVSLAGPLTPLSGGATVTGQAKDSLMAATEGAWNDIVNKGLADLVRNLKTRLAAN